MTNFEKLQKLLEELFQLDQADLDFGIYRIMNQKRDEVVRFLEKDLLPQVKEAFRHYKSADKSEVQKELDKLTQQIQSAGMNPDDSPKVKELKAQMDDSSVDVMALENEVFSHLFNFFRRYYHEGDFISLRRYKEGVYAIPYEGEEVKLHWANHDQYYVKSSEYFRDYIFTMPSGKRVRVHLVAASSEQDNKKEASGKERRFIICEEDPIYEENGELYIRFEYRPDNGKKKQDALNQEAIERVLKSKGFEEWTLELSKPAPTKSNPKRTVLEKHLAQYTARNTFDYFIHKDLGGFLRRELDFYIKNEVMHLDDIEHDTVPRVEQYLSKIKVIRKIAHKLIQFLEQLENFQKKLWLKRKFVLETNYYITLDRVPKELYPEIVANDSQREEWVRLFAIDQSVQKVNEPGYSVPLTIAFLDSNRHLPIDTKFYTSTFRDRLLAHIEELDDQCTGLLICSENANACRLLAPRFAGQISTFYVDPPYNTQNNEFPYKDSYQHSSWLAFLDERVGQCRLLMKQNGVFLSSIDRNEMHRAVILHDTIFGESNRLAEFAWERGRKNDAKHVSLSHEYFLLYAKDLEALKASQPEWREQKPALEQAKAKFSKLREQYGTDFARIKQEFNLWVGTKLDPAHARSILLYNKLDGRGPYRDDTDMSWPGGGGPRYEIINPSTGEKAEIPSRGWRFIESTMRDMLAKGEVEFDPENSKRLMMKRYYFEDSEQVKSSVLYKHSKAATRLIRDVFGWDAFPNPKDHELIGELLDYVTPNGGWIMDHFAGSGTTAHAVSSIIRQRKKQLRFILVEVAEYFDSILKPRVIKTKYSDDWVKGRPGKATGESFVFKYCYLETFEDALNNLELTRTGPQQQLLDADPDVREQYLLSYMLEFESRGSNSLLNIQTFRNPSEYKLRVDRNGETQIVNVDLVETFNWLLGLTVKHIDAISLNQDGPAMRVVEGIAPNSDRVLVLWRNLDDINNDALDSWFKKQKYNTKDQEYDLIYVNGDNNLENLRRYDQTWKVRLIEEEFGRLMFDVQNI